MTRRRFLEARSKLVVNARYRRMKIQKGIRLMVITSIVSLDQKRSRVLLDQDLALVLYSGDLHQFHMAEGRELTQETYESLVEQVLKPRARERVLKALQVSDKTRWELISLLSREGYPEEVREDAVSMAEKYRYVDDRAFGERYVEGRGQRKSRKRLISDMQKRGFDQELVKELLAAHPVDEERQIRDILEKKGICPEQIRDKKEWGRVAGMLARKGYSYEAVSRVFRNMEAFFD